MDNYDVLMDYEMYCSINDTDDNWYRTRRFEDDYDSYHHTDTSYFLSCSEEHPGPNISDPVNKDSPRYIHNVLIPFGKEYLNRKYGGIDLLYEKVVKLCSIDENFKRALHDIIDSVIFQERGLEANKMTDIQNIKKLMEHSDLYIDNYVVHKNPGLDETLYWEYRWFED